MSSSRLRDCGADDVRALQHWLDRWTGSVRWPPRGMTPSPQVLAELIWADAPVQKIVVGPDGRDTALLVLHAVDLHHFTAELSWLVDPDAPGLGDGLATFVALAFRSQPVRKLTFEVAADGFDVRPQVAFPLHHVGRRSGHLRRSADLFVDVDVFEVHRDVVVDPARDPWSRRGV